MKQNRIKELRKENKMTVSELAERLGVSQSMLTGYERGASVPRSFAVYELLAAIFNVSVPHLLGFTTDIQAISEYGWNGETYEWLSLYVDSWTEIYLIKRLQTLNEKEMEEVIRFIEKLKMNKRGINDEYAKEL